MENLIGNADVVRRLCLFTKYLLLTNALSMVPTIALAAEAGFKAALKDYFGSLQGEVAVMLDSHRHDAKNESPDEKATIWVEVTFQNYVYLSSTVVFDSDVRLNVSLPNIQSGNFTRPDEIDPSIPFLDVRKAVLKWQGEGTEVIAGIDTVKMGFAELYSPVDKYASYHFGKPQQYRERGDVLLMVSRFIQNDTLSFTLFPYQQDAIDPQANSRWLNSQGDREFFNEAGSNVEKRSNSSMSDWGYLVKYDGVRSGYDFYTAIHTGPSTYPVISAITPILGLTEKRYPLATTISAGFTATSGGWNYYADILYLASKHNVDQSYSRYALGFSFREANFANRIGLMEIKPIITYSGEHVTDAAEDPMILVTSEFSRPHPDSILSRIDFKVSDKINSYVSWSRNLSDGDTSMGFGVEYSPDDSFSMFARGLYLDGKPETQFGRWRNNDFFTVGMSYRY